VILYPFVFSFFVKAVCIDVEYMICCYRILSLSFSFFLSLSLSFFFFLSFIPSLGGGGVFFSCCFFFFRVSVVFFFFFFFFFFPLVFFLFYCFFWVMVFFFSCTDGFFLGGDLCASKCRLCLTPLVCVSWNGKAF